MKIRGIRAKLWAGFGILILLMGWVGLVGWQNTVEFPKEAEGL